MKGSVFILFLIFNLSSKAQVEVGLDSSNLEFYNAEFALITVEDSMFFSGGDHKEYFIKFPEACLTAVDKIWIEVADTEHNKIILHVAKTKSDFLSSSTVNSGLAEYSLGKIFEANYTVSVLFEINGHKKPKITKTITI